MIKHIKHLVKKKINWWYTKFMLEKAIRAIPEQFAFEPLIENEGKLKKKHKYIVCGMGGSQLSADILKGAKPELDLIAWRDYGLPPVADLSDRLIIASSYSGNTEETIQAFNLAREKGLALAVISKGGKLIELARENKIPFVLIPDTGIQPRQATGFMIRALMAVLRLENDLRETRSLLNVLDSSKLELEGEDLAKRLKGYIPVIYSSLQNEALAKNWKIKFNENGKIPAFWGVFPEINHNEMTGFESEAGAKKLAQKFRFIFISDDSDNPHIRKRMKVMKDLLVRRALEVEVAELKGEKRYERIFSNLILGEWASYHTALLYGTEPEHVPMVEEFKKLI